MSLFRHDLVFVSPIAWSALLDMREDLAREPLVAQWVDQGWPLVARRFSPGEADGVPLGLPLPPSLGKRRVSVLMQRDDIVAVARPQRLGAAIDVAPTVWQPVLQRLVDVTAAHHVEPRIFGSLAWRALTGLDYVTATSDLDLLLPLPRRRDVADLTASLAAIEAAGPMRLDGELMRDDGAGVNWREIHAGDHREVLVKTTRTVELVDVHDFLDARRGVS